MRDNRPLVSVIMPTYNRTTNIREALASAVLQSYKNIEVIVSDNASAETHYEELLKIVDSFSDPRIRVRRNASNLGILGNNLVAFREARGEYVANLHDDDIWEPEFLETLVSALETTPGASLAFSDHFIIDDAGEIDPMHTEQSTRTWGRDQLESGLHRPFHHIGLIARSIPTVMAAVMRKSAIDWDDFPPHIGNGYDLWLTYLACRDGMGAYYCPERLTRYRVHSQSATATSLTAMHQGLANCYRHFLIDLRLRSIWKDCRRKLSNLESAIGLALLRQGKREEAAVHLRKSLKTQWSLRAISSSIIGLMPVPFALNVLESAGNIKRQYYSR